jgi:hypothetical protein
MSDHARALLAQTAALTLEADPADWADQHRPVPLPDDEYPHVDTHTVIDRYGG